MGDRLGVWPRRRGEEGQAIAELVIAVPVLLLVVMLMVFFGRIESAQADVESAARAGVQAAVVQAGPNDAQSSAATAVANTLSSEHIACASPSVSTDVANFVPGGWVTVTVTCLTSLADVSIPGVPGSRTFTASSVAHVDPFRS